MASGTVESYKMASGTVESDYILDRGRKPAGLGCRNKPDLFIQNRSASVLVCVLLFHGNMVIFWCSFLFFFF